MSNSKDLDSYGDWVKKPPRDINGDDSSEGDNAVDVFGFPDLGEPDLESGVLPKQTSDAEDDDTTLSPEELAHITVNQDSMPEEFEDPTIDPAAAALGNAFSEEARLAEAAEENVDEFEIPASIDEPLPEEVEISDAGEATEEVSFDAMADGDIDLDSFMDDSGGGSGEISFGDGEIDLDDFMGGDFMGGGPSSSKAPAEIQDEQTLEINIGFDEEAESIALEDTPENEAKMFPKKEEPAQTENDAMFNSFEEAVAADVSSESAAESEVLSADDGEIDLSEFGFDDDDSNIGMTEGPDGNEPVKRDVVDYDVRVVVDDDSKTPPVQDVVNGKIVAEDQNVDSEEDEITEQNELTNATPSSASPEISEKGKEILEDIIGQLASLKDEIKSLKNEFANLSARPANEIPATAPVEEAQEEDTGFFGNDDGDDTIALSGSEMTNILKSAQFSEGTAEEAPSAEEDNFEPAFEEPIVEDTIEDAPVEAADVSDTAPTFEEPLAEEDKFEPAFEEPIAEDIAEEPLAEEDNFEPAFEEPILEDTFEEEAVEVSESTSAEPTEEPTIADDGDAFISDDGLGIEDPTLESLSDEDQGNPIPPTILPEEIAVPKTAPVAKAESASDAAPDVAEIVKENISLQDNSEAAVEIDSNIDAAFEEADALESDIMDNSLEEKDAYEDSVSDIMNENISLQDDKTEASVGIENDIDTAFEEADAAESDIMDDSLAEKDAYEKKINELVDDDGDSLGLDDDEGVKVVEVQEPIEDSLEETSVEEPVIEEPAPTAETKSAQTSIPKNLREEVIAVLSYMDQLLENLPEEKITEFAKSEHFVTYKRLFDELGLS